MPAKRRICRRCLLSDKIPGVRIGDDGHCNLCARSALTTFIPRRELNSLVEKIRRTPSSEGFHCAVACSGGKDSSYLLWLLARRYRLKVLAVHVNTGYDRTMALRNLQRVVSRLGTGLAIIEAGDLLKGVYRYAFSHGFFSVENGLACHLCSNLLPNLMGRLCVERNIQWLATGHVNREEPVLVRSPQAVLLDAQKWPPVLYRYVLRHPLVLSGTGPGPVPALVHPLNAEDYSERKVMARVRALVGSRNDFRSDKTACAIVRATMHLYLSRFDYNPYLSDIAGKIRHGVVRKTDWELRLRRIESQMRGPRGRAEARGVLKSLGGRVP